MSGDVLIALDGLKVGLDLEDRLKLYRIGESVSWAAFRRGRLVQGELRFLENPYPPMELVPVEKASAKQKQSFEAWTGAKWDFED
jgi:predicted metalloprotease with PDZ domain